MVPVKQVKKQAVQAIAAKNRKLYQKKMAALTLQDMMSMGVLQVTTKNVPMRHPARLADAQARFAENRL